MHTKDTRCVNKLSNYTVPPTVTDKDSLFRYCRSVILTLSANPTNDVLNIYHQRRLEEGIVGPSNLKRSW